MLVSPLLEAWCVFMQLKKRTDDRLNITCHVLPLEAAMNKACGSDGIWIESVEQQEVMVLHFEREVADRVTMRMMIIFSRRVKMVPNMLIHAGRAVTPDAARMIPTTAPITRPMRIL